MTLFGLGMLFGFVLGVVIVLLADTMVYVEDEESDGN